MSGIEREVFFCERCEAIGEESACSCDDKGRWVTLVVTAAENLTRAERERDEARAEVEVLAEQVARMNVEGLRDDRRAAAEVARWKAEAERYREAEAGGDRLYRMLAFFDRRDGTPLSACVRAAREGWERSGPDMREDGAWDEFDARIGALSAGGGTDA